MQTEFVLGPAIEIVVEPEPPAPPVVPPGRRWIEFADPATEIGGVVHVRFLPATDPADKVPVNIYAVYVSPHTSAPAKEQRTPDWFFAAHDGITKAVGHLQVGNPDDGVKTIKVDGVKPGAHLLQTILEFPK